MIWGYPYFRKPPSLEFRNPCAAWCWHIYLHLPFKNHPNVGKYSSTMVRIWENWHEKVKKKSHISCTLGISWGVEKCWKTWSIDPSIHFGDDMRVTSPRIPRSWRATPLWVQRPYKDPYMLYIYNICIYMVYDIYSKFRSLASLSLS